MAAPSFFPSPMPASSGALSSSSSVATGPQTLTPHHVPPKRPRATSTKNREPVTKIAVECGSHKGTMHLDRFRGSKCAAQFIEVPGDSGSGSSRWMTAKNFADMDGKKDWKQCIRHGKWNLKKLEKWRYLVLEMKKQSTCAGCSCPDCCPGRRHVSSVNKKRKLMRKLQEKKDRTAKSSSTKSLAIHSKELTRNIAQSMDDQVQATAAAADAACQNMTQSQSRKLENESKIIQRSCSVDSVPKDATRAAVSTCSTSSPLPSAVDVKVSTSSKETVPRHDEPCKPVISRPVVSCQPISRVLPKFETPSEFAVYFTSARGIDARLRCQVAKAFPDISNILRWPSEQFLIYRKHMLLYMLDLTRALGAKRDIARATHLIYDLQPTDVRRYETMIRLSGSLDDWDLVREIKRNIKQLNELTVGTGSGVTCSELRKIASSGKHVEICLSVRLSTALDPFTSTIPRPQAPAPPLSDEIFVWERDVELRPIGLKSKSELEKLRSWMTRRLSYGDIWILPDDPTMQPHTELICSTADQLRRVLLTPTDPTDVKNVLCFVGSVDMAVVKSRTDYVRHCVSSLVARARDRIRSSMMASGWIAMSLFVVVDVGPGAGMTTLRQIADDEVLDRSLQAAFVGVDVHKQCPTCAVLHLEVKIPGTDILNSCFN